MSAMLTVEAKVKSRALERAFSSDLGDQMLYLLNSPVLTAYGDYRYRGVSREEARELLAPEPNFVSAVGHAATAHLLSDLLGISVPENRIRVTMQAGDRALVFALKTRLEEGRVLDAEAIRNTEFDWGLLERVN